jgi:hypothetical protein
MRTVVLVLSASSFVQNPSGNPTLTVLATTSADGRGAAPPWSTRPGPVPRPPVPGPRPVALDGYMISLCVSQFCCS